MPVRVGSADAGDDSARRFMAMRDGYVSKRVWTAAGVVLAVLALHAPTARAEEPAVFPWYVSPSIGRLDYEGDEPVRDALAANLRLGCDGAEWWSVEGTLMIVPYLDEQFRTDWETGRKISRLYEEAGVHSTWAVGLAVDGLYHFSRWERLDPYLTVGAGLIYYGDNFGNQVDPAIRAGAGVMYHFNDEWAVRANFRAFFAGEDTEANSIIDAGVVWNWGAGIPPNTVVTGAPVDSDADGLLDEEELVWKTNPYDPDTDKDGLTDGEEVKKWHTQPLNPDTDLDGLKDGYDEVLKWGTDPLKRDTDDGGVADGHEVIEDNTDPLNGADDLILFKLYIQFDYDKSVIKSQYNRDLDIIGKVLKRNPGSSARIEGHADKLKNSKPDYNRKLSQRRAAAALNYLADKAHIERSRLEAIGYGFDRPEVPNDPVMGNPLNRRVEIYIRGAEGEKERIKQGRGEKLSASEPPAVDVGTGNAPGAAPAANP